MKLSHSMPFILFIAAGISVQAQHSCCSASATEQFAMLGKDPAFAASHLAPLPFHYNSENGKMITYKIAGDKDASAFEVRAAKPTNNYLIVIHEYWGLNDYIKQEAERLQKELGNVNVIAPDLYDGRVASDPDTAVKYMQEAKENRIREILRGAIKYSGKNAKIETVGWCFGGGWSLQTAIMAGRQATGCVMYYGMPEKDVQKIKSLNAPVLGLFASKDKWITPEVAQKFEKDMKANNKQITIKEFPADHAFANPSNPHYDKPSKEQADKMALDFLKKHLG